MTGGSLTIVGGAQITIATVGPGNAGPVAVSASRLLINDGAAISTQALQASGGSISLSVGDLLYLAGSEVTTSVQGATRASNGGNIMIIANLTVLDHGDIVADANGGNGGNIGTVTGTFIASWTASWQPSRKSASRG